MFRSLYNWTLRLAGHRHAVPAMAAVSFAESSFFPIPPDVVLIPIVLQRREQAYRIALVCTVFSVLGGLLGYAIGALLRDTVGEWLIRVYGMSDGVAEYTQLFATYGVAIILLKGLTPIPFKLVTIAAGIAKFNLPLFIMAAIVTRAFRFFLIAFLLRRYGEPVQAFIERRLNLIGLALIAALIAGFAVVMLL
jgi:membrane protein YqaA with SNARE-associated domain